MRFFAEELPPAYARYQFGYAQWAELDEGPVDVARMGELYAAGYLPASHAPYFSPPRFYRARSLRVDLAALAMGKKRRYQQRQLTQAGWRWEVSEKGAFFAEQHEADWKARFLGWIAARFDPPYLDAARLDYILAKAYANQIGSLVDAEGRAVGHAILCGWQGGGHYWFAAYDPAHETPGLSLGKGMMGAFLLDAQATGLTHAYLGTGYGAKAAYKFHGLTAGTEWWTGNAWSTDKAAWQARCAEDPK